MKTTIRSTRPDERGQTTIRSTRSDERGQTTIRSTRPDERGQTTAEYALVLLAAGTVAMLIVAWAQDNGAIGGLLDAVLDKITSLIE